jgi:hypothetical protein
MCSKGEELMTRAPRVSIGLVVAGCFLADRFWAPTGMLNFFVQMATLVPALVIGIVFSFSKELSAQLRGQPEGFTRRWDAALQTVKRAQ